LKGNIKQQFDRLIITIEFNKLDSVYETGHIDGAEYRLYIESDTITKRLYIHSMRPPKELESLKDLFIKMKGGLSFVPIGITINFRVNPPEPPPLQ